MGRFFLFFGVILIIFSIVYMFVLLAGSEIEFTGEIIASVICESNETLDQSYRRTFSSSSGSSTTTDFYCVDSEGAERDVTGKMILYTVGGFLGTFLPGLFMLIGGAGSLARNRMKTLTGQFLSGQNLGNIQGSTIHLSSGRTQYEAKSMDDVKEIMDHVFSQAQSQSQRPNMTLTGSLSDKLKQLEDARDQGLISQSEYDRIRQAILDNLDD